MAAGPLRAHNVSCRERSARVVQYETLGHIPYLGFGSGYILPRDIMIAMLALIVEV